MKHLLPKRVRAALVIVLWFAAAACQNGSAAPGADQGGSASPSISTPQPMAAMPDAAAPGEQSSDAGGTGAAPAGGTQAAAPAAGGAGARAKSEAGSGGAGARAKSEAGSGGAGAASSLPSLCSGCSGETQDRMDMTVHLHHVHMNVADRERSAQFYQQFFKAQRVRLNDVTEALHVVPTLLLLDQQASAPPSGLPTAFQHIGWGSADVGA